jgi:hypothetical protein
MELSEPWSDVYICDPKMNTTTNWPPPPAAPLLLVVLAATGSLVRFGRLP